MMTDTEINELLTPKLSELLGEYGFDRADVLSDLDHDGDPALFVIAHYRPRARELDAERAIEAIGAMMALLRDRGDDRFPYLRHAYPDDEFAIDAEPEPKTRRKRAIR